VDLSATMIAGSSNTDTLIYVWIQAGITGIFFLKGKALTTLGEIIEDDLAVQVRELHK
jgi:hypothetical protein